jgi:two-component system, NarL family, nitrate/nitrite response regulator NarL
VRVLVGDAYPVFRDGLAASIRSWPEFELVGATGRSDFLRALMQLEPDVAVADPNSLALHADDILDSASGRTRVIFLSGHCDEQAVFGALTHGAYAYLMKSANAEELRYAVAKTARGQPVIPPAVQFAVTHALYKRGEVDDSPLTQRQQQVLRLMAEGLSVSQAACALGIRPRTVSKHIESITSTLGVHTQKEAIAVAMRARLLR